MARKRTEPNEPERQPEPAPSRFRKAARQAQKLRLALDGPAGSGKTFTSLRLAFALGPRVAVIDTEHERSALYHRETIDGSPWEFELCTLPSHDPDEYVAALDDAAAGGFDVVIIDSLSHAWDGVGGALDQVDQLASESKSGNTFSPWREVTPKHRRLIEAILACPIHVIATLRSKTEYAMERDHRTGRMAPRKIGLAPVQRQGIEYEFDLAGSLNADHTLTITKSRCRAITDQVVPLPGPAFMRPVLQWLNGELVLPPEPARAPARDEMTNEEAEAEHERLLAEQEAEAAAAEQAQADHLAETRAASGGQRKPRQAAPAQQTAAPLMASGEQVDTIASLADGAGLTDEQLAAQLRKKFGVGTVGQLTADQAEMTITALGKMPVKKGGAA